MKKRSIRKTGKRILTLLAVISITSVITACSGGDGTESTDDSEPLEESRQDKTEHEQAAEALLQYRDQLRFCDLSGTQLIYEEMETEGYRYFMTQGLKGLPEKKEGCLDAVILDLDEDGMEELLTFDLQEGSEAYQIQAKVYEYQDGQVVESAVWEFLNDAIADQCDGGEIRFMIKDDKYICMDSRQHTFISADGVSIVLSACYYDGAEMVNAAEFYFVGSDWSDLGKEETELIEQLRSMGFDKTADAIYDRDDFHLYAADKGGTPHCPK
ncbi:MAG: hypothetical protein K2N15_12590 [Lachnospiraceae bacterium]|nr:hypothetical protein [Lachnospiraceae bacterium]